jgi:hypothetical protein
MEPTFLPKFGRPVMFVIEREQNKRSEEAKRLWEVKSLEPTFLPKFGRPVMFVTGDSGDRTRDLSHPKRESYR